MNKLDTSPQCQAARPYYYDHLCGQGEQIPQNISAHIASCPDCQNEVQWLKQADSKSEEFSLQKLQTFSHTAQMQSHCALIDQPVRCSDVKPFLPILAAPEMSVRISTPVTAHIQACEDCARDLETLKGLSLSDEQRYVLAQIFSLNHSENSLDTQAVAETLFQDAIATNTAIRQIMERPDSEVVTCFRAQDTSVSQSNNSFAVKVAQNEAYTSINPPADNRQTSQVQTTSSSARSRWMIKPLAAAAALVIATILLFQSPSVKATDIGEIYAALKDVKNIMMTQYDADIEAPVQATYISQSLGIKLFETSGIFTVYDIKNKTQKMKAGSASEIQQTNIDREMVQTIVGSMDVPWGLLPFKKDADLPNGATWEKVHPQQTDSISEQTEIFDLSWNAQVTGGENINYQWRCYLDAVTKRPFKVEWRQKNQLNQKYELITFTEISYPTENQIKEVLEQIGL